MKENDCISRKRAIERLKLNLPISQGADNSRDRHRYMQALADIQAIRELPSATPQEPQTFKWCTDCKEYDQEKHCCHRWSKVIRDTVEEMKQEQEPILDKIRAEIKQYQSDYDVHGTEYDRTAWKAFNRCLQIIDKYKVEIEPQESEEV